MANQECRVLTGSFDKTVRLWEGTAGAHLLHFADHKVTATAPY